MTALARLKKFYILSDIGGNKGIKLAIEISWTMDNTTLVHVSVVVIFFLSQLNFVFLLFWGMVLYIYTNEVQT